MRRISSVLGVSLAMTIGISCAQAADEIPPPLKKGQKLAEFNKALLDAGWKAVDAPIKNAVGEVVRESGTEKDLYGDGFKAIEYCSGTDSNFCFFNYKKNNQCLRVQTRGEYEKQSRLMPVVYGWKTECPKPGGPFTR